MPIFYSEWVNWGLNAASQLGKSGNHFTDGSLKSRLLGFNEKKSHGISIKKPKTPGPGG